MCVPRDNCAIWNQRDTYGACRCDSGAISTKHNLIDMPQKVLISEDDVGKNSYVAAQYRPASDDTS